jgi:uncharacterized protein YgbK (DUF1537 family)
VEVSLSLRGGVGPGIRVVDTETRHRSGDEAAAVVRAYLTGYGGAVFKKTDSTLRGNIRAELGAMAELGTVVFVPAYPALGRTVRDGILYVHGVPLGESAFAADARQPVRSSRVGDVVPEGVRVFDAWTEADLEAIARELAEERPWVAGPAGFIRYWAGMNGFATGVVRVAPRVGSWLLVCGSRHPVSRRQADLAGIPVIRTAEEMGDPETVAAALAEEVRVYVERFAPEGVLIMGGDTVWAVWRALGIEELAPLPEVLPGIAACVGGGRLFVTKAGGFGEDGLVEQILERFR